MPFMNGLKQKQIRKKIPFIVQVNKDETENFLKDIMKQASKITPSKKTIVKSIRNKLILFIKWTLISFLFISVFVYISFTSYYFISHAF